MDVAASIDIRNIEQGNIGFVVQNFMGYTECTFSQRMITKMLGILFQVFLAGECGSLPSIQRFTLSRITKDEITNVIPVNIVDMAWERNGCDVMVSLHDVRSCSLN